MKINISMTYSNNEGRRIYIFDAKYRLCVEGNGDIGPMEDDINVMHRYRDAIVEELGDTMQFKYKTFGAYVMFPYSDESEFSHNKYYKSIESVNIGAFPMLPGSTSLIRNHLEKILCLSTIEAKQERVAVDEFDDYAKFKLKNVMVVNVKDEDHLKAYVKNKFYHIPARRLSNVRLGVEYLAFYESKKSFSEGSGINFYGKIKEMKRYKRFMCSEIPVGRGNSEEEYLRFELEGLIEINNIKPVEYGTQLITYTTLYLLKNAGNIHELKLKNREEIDLYKLLKKISKEKGVKLLRKTDCYVVDGRVIEMLLHREVRVDGRIVGFGEIEGVWV
ncbi:nuclease domain-containing protein [Clostridium sp.]|uniref:nuclease domain-containing protein n=1 Tax=Clostridium sp. TaxID=1506 RepID=UPI003D6D380E